MSELGYGRSMCAFISCRSYTDQYQLPKIYLYDTINSIQDNKRKLYWSIFQFELSKILSNSSKMFHKSTNFIENFMTSARYTPTPINALLTLKITLLDDVYAFMTELIRSIERITDIPSEKLITRPRTTLPSKHSEHDKHFANRRREHVEEHLVYP